MNKYIYTLSLLLLFLANNAFAQKASKYYNTEINSLYPANYEQDDNVIKKLYLKENNGLLSNYKQEDEVLDKRDASSKTFKNSNGTFTSVLGSGQIHYFEGKIWKTISNEIVPEGNGYYNKWNEFKTQYQNNSINITLKNKTKVKIWQQPSYVFLDVNENEISYSNLLFNNPIVNNDELTYHSSESSIDAKIKQLSVGTELSYIIYNSSVFSAINNAMYFGFKERITIGKDAIVSVKQDAKRGSLVIITDKIGNEIMEYENPIISENSLRNTKDSAANVINGKYKIKQLSSNEYEITYYAELSWFQNPNRQFPITFDPTVNCVPSNVTYGTGYFRHHVIAANDGVDNDWRVGHNDLTDDEYYEGFAKINLSSLYTCYTINSAVFKIYKTSLSNYSGNNDIKIRFGTFDGNPVTDSWNTIHSNINGMVTEYARYGWNNSNTTYSGFLPDPYGNNSNTAGWFTMTGSASDVLSRISQGYINIGSDDMIEDGWSGSVSDDSYWLNFMGTRGNANQPYLIVDYTVPTASTAATGISATRTSVYTCDNSVTLTVSGGSLGSKASWKWYAGGCGSGSSIGSGTSIVVTPSSTTTYYVRAEDCYNTATGCASVTINVSAPPAVPTTASQWNVACYNGDNFNTYYGYYNQTSLDFNTATRWTNTPSDANATGGAAYIGCPIPADYHSYNYKRTNFPCGIYDINILGHDDNTEILINGTSQFNHIGCCDAHSAAVKTFLNSTDVVEIKTREFTGGSNTSVSFTTGTPVTTAATANSCAISRYQANWNAVVGASKYYIDIDNNSDFSSPEVNNVDVGNVTSYQIDLPIGTTYYYRIRAYNSTCAITSGNSNTTSFTTSAVLTPNHICTAVRVGAADIGAGQTQTSATYNNGSSDNNTGGINDPVNADANQRTDWFYFTTPSTIPSQYYFEFVNYSFGTLGGLELELYEKTGTSGSCSCAPTLSYLGSHDPSGCGVGGESGGFCLQPNKTYYLMVDEEYDGACGGTGTYQMRVRGGSDVAAPDNICNAVQVGAGTIGVGQSATTGTYTNSCSTLNTGGNTDPANAQSNDATDWYYFTTPATIPSQYYFNFNNIGDFGTYGGLEGEVYKKTGGTCPPTLSYVGSWDPDACGVVEQSGGFCLDPSSTYYIMADEERDGLCGGRGRYQLVVQGGSQTKAPDNICNAVQIGGATIGVNQTATSATYDNYCSTVNTGGFTDPANADPNQGTDWFYFTTPSTIPSQYYFEFVNYSFGTLGGLELEVYKRTAAGSCPGTAPTLSYVGSHDPALCGVGGESNGFCLEANTTYYLMVDEEFDGSCTGRGTYQLRVRGDVYTSGPDNVCSATSMGTMPNATTGGLTLNNQSNECAGTQTNEPSGGQKTVWYTFTTGATVAKDFNINVDAYSNGMDAEVYVYEACTPPICSGSVLNAGEFNELANFWNGLLVPALGIGEWDASGTITGRIKPSTTYYIRVDGVDLYGGLSGNFNLSISFSGGAYNGNDEFCNAWLVGSLPASGTSESITDNDILDLGETITVGTFNNKSASTQEDCELDEWNNDEDDETVWFKFVTASNPGTEIEVDVNAINDGVGGLDCIGGLSYAWTKAYVTNGSPVITCPTFTNSTNWFNGIEEAGRDDLVDASKYYIDCPSPSTTYYIQVENQGIGCDQSSFTMTVKDNGIPRAPNDKICNAIVLDATTSPLVNPRTLIGTYNKHQLVNQNNFCAGTGSDDPAACWSNDENDKTVWYKLPAVPNDADISNNGRQVVIINAYSNHAAGPDEDEINLQLALYSNSNLPGSCPTNPTSGFALAKCAYVGPISLTSFAEFSEYLTAECLDPTKDYYLQVDGNDLDLTLDEVLREGWFEFDAYYPREIGDLPCDAVGFKTWGIPGQPATASDELLNCSNLCTSHTPGVGAGQEPPATFTTGNGNDNPGWVYFYAPASGSVKITATNNGSTIRKDKLLNDIDLQLAIFQESTVGNCSIVQPPQSPVSAITSYNILDGYGEEMYVNCLSPGRKYYIMVDASTSPITQTKHIFDLKIENWPENSAATNDLMQGAIAFTNTYTPTADWNKINYKVTETILNSKNWCADNLNEPGSTGSDLYNETGVWYKFIAPPSGMVHFLAENTDYGSITKLSGDPNHIDISLAVYQLNAGYPADSFSNPLATTLIKKEYDNILVNLPIPIAVTGTSAEDEDMTVECLTPGKEYYLLLSGKKSAGVGSDWDYGRYNLYMTSHPRNPAKWNGATVTVSGNQYLPSPLPASIDSVCNAANLGTMPAGTAWFQPFGNIQVPLNCASNNYLSPTFNNFCATATNDPIPGYQQDLVNVFGGNHKPVWFKFTTPATGAYDASRISCEVEVLSGDCDAGVLDGDWYDRGSAGCSPDDENYQDCINAGVSVWLPSAVPTLCNTSLYEMDSDYDILNFDEQADIHCLDPNTEYYIMVDGASLNQEGNFNVRVQQITPDPRPINNYICDAKKLTTGAITSPASFWGAGAAYRYDDEFNICADTRKDGVSASGTEPIPSGWDVVSPPSDAADMTHTVWYTFRTPAPAADYAVHIDVNSQLPWPFGDLVNPKIAVWEAQDNTCAYTHPNGTNMVEMASEYDPLAFWSESIDVYCLKPNKQYYVQVGGTTNVYGQDQGYFDIVINDITPIAIPVNDDVCSAVNMGTMSNVVNSKLGNASSGASNYHNYCTDLEAGEPVPAAFTPDNTVWFKFRTPNNAGKRYNVTVNANSDPAPDHNDGINLQLALYESSVLGSCAFANFTELESDFDAILWDETLTATCLKPNTDYYIQVDGTKGFLELFRAQGFGYFGIEVVTTAYYDAPVNDNMCNATNLGTVPVAGQLAPATWFYNTCATLELNEIDPVGDVIDYGIEKTVWFKFVPGRDADFKISAISDCLFGVGCDPVDLQVALFRPTSGLAPACPTYADMVQEAADYDLVFFDEDLTAPCLRSGQTYYIQVDGSALNGDGEFQIKVEDMGSSTVAPANDNFCAATLMTFTAGVASLTNQSNVCATIQASEPQTPASVQKSVWYKFQAPPSGRVRITTHDADGALRGLDPEFYVYQNGSAFNCASFGNLTPNGSAYNPLLDIPIIAPNLGDESVENECFVPGWWYLIQVDGTTVGGPQGKFDIKIEDLLMPYTVASGNKPSNDDFASAKTLTIQTEACSEGTGRTDLHGSGSWDPENYGKSTRDMINGFGDAGCSVADLCGDLWYKFNVTSPICNNGYSPMIIQGKAESSLTDGSKLHIIAYKGSAGALTVLGCGEASSTLTNSSYFNFEINEAIGTTIYLQVFGENADDWDEDFEICVSEKRGFDYCAHAAASPPMIYDVDYCYNIKGATAEPSATSYDESCPLSGIPGLPNPDGDAPTENSVYFKFVTDNTCSDYRLNFKYYFTNYSGVNDKGISYTIYKDDTPCDGVALGSGALDCQTFYNSNAGSFEYDILFSNNSYLSTPVGVDNNSTYYIQIDGPGNNFGNLDGTLKITQIPICLPIVIDSVPSQTLTTFYTCGDGWRHYYRLEGGVRKYKWSLFDNGNTSLQGDVTLTYNTGANFYSATNGCIEASWVMRRYWNYNVTGGSIAADKPVSIRFYYIPAEKQAIIDQMNTFAATGCDGFVESFEWFKSHDGVAFNPALHIDPEYVIARYGSGGSTSAGQSLTVLDNQTSCNVLASGIYPAIPGVRYVEYQNLLSFSGGTGATGNGDDPSPLPIELASFTGYHNADKYENNLNWVTASEVNSSRFVVEKSLDGASFTYLGEKSGAGNSTTTLNYDFVDTKPALGDNYYRLKMIDKDGTFEYSKIINVNVGVGTAGSQILGIYPNPTHGMLNIRFLSGEKEKFTMRVMNTTGQVVRENTFDFAAGINFIEMNTFDFADGLYILQFVGENGGRFDGKFVKE